MESKRAKSLPDSFAEDLTSFICGKVRENEDGNSESAMIKKAEHQAGPSATKCVVDDEAGDIAPGNSDFSTRAGSSSRRFDLMMTDLTFDEKDLSAKTGKFATVQRDAAYWIESSLVTRTEGKIVFPRTFKDRLSKKISSILVKLRKLSRLIACRSFYI